MSGPVASQLDRIEQGLDKLMQSHAALEKKIDACDLHQEANEMRIAIARDLHIGQMAELRQMITNLDTRVHGMGGGLATEIAVLRENYSQSSGRLSRLLDIFSTIARPIKTKQKRKK